RNRPIIIGESDPEGCAACSARVYPQNAYRNGVLYPCYTAAVLKRTYELAERHKVNIEGAVTWAFEFEDQPYFDGLRTLATNGVAKPVLNVFRMLGLMGGEQIDVASTGARNLDAMLQAGVRGAPDINALATTRERQIAVLAWNYHDDEAPAPDATVHLVVEGTPARVLLRHYRIDQRHSNAYTVWNEMGSPQAPSAEQYARLKQAGELQLLASPQWLRAEGGKVEIPFSLPRHAVALVELSW
ncbi:MAG: beta-xylosidase, partial [Acidobacteria bacterium]|nr:beta-xylosidase [Acidobacteriota bacterium]